MNKKSNIIIGIVAVVVIIGSVTLLGRSGQGEQGKEVKVGATKVVGTTEKTLEEAEDGVIVSTSTAVVGKFVASKQGKKYFPVDCGSSKTIKEQNRVYFSTEAEAITAGYEKSKSCK